MVIDLQSLRDAVDGTAAAFRCVTDYQPAGGPGDKVFPPTYEGGRYATEERVDPGTGEVRQCVLLDSVQSQANRMELALLESHRAGKVELPLLVTPFRPGGAAQEVHGDEPGGAASYCGCVVPRQPAGRHNLPQVGERRHSRHGRRSKCLWIVRPLSYRAGVRVVGLDRASRRSGSQVPARGGVGDRGL